MYRRFKSAYKIKVYVWRLGHYMVWKIWMLNKIFLKVLKREVEEELYEVAGKNEEQTKAY